ncbi:hypothetical protein BaRGS_00018642 [Batillaria attramentaria]|uniref:Uncharacterized protein n=1 Tax=Batillaria attramentaria TaxID=370345 RepID=A0ABD0KTG1_9CAEN
MEGKAVQAFLLLIRTKSLPLPLSLFIYEGSPLTPLRQSTLYTEPDIMSASSGQRPANYEPLNVARTESACTHYMYTHLTNTGQPHQQHGVINDRSTDTADDQESPEDDVTEYTESLSSP